jgi:hypothetical protein
VAGTGEGERTGERGGEALGQQVCMGRCASSPIPGGCGVQHLTHNARDSKVIWRLCVATSSVQSQPTVSSKTTSRDMITLLVAGSRR